MHVLRPTDDPTVHEWYVNSTGLMGSFPSGEMVARDGVTLMDDLDTVG